MNTARGVVSKLGRTLESPEEYGKGQFFDPILRETFGYLGSHVEVFSAG